MPLMSGGLGTHAGSTKQLEMLQKIRRRLADVATSRKCIELHAAKLQASSAAKLDDQARQALAQAREDYAGPIGGLDELLASGALEDLREGAVMIVRILGESRFEVDDARLAELNHLDEAGGVHHSSCGGACAISVLG